MFRWHLRAAKWVAGSKCSCSCSSSVGVGALLVGFCGLVFLVFGIFPFFFFLGIFLAPWVSDQWLGLHSLSLLL